MHQCIKFISFGVTLYMFRTALRSDKVRNATPTIRKINNNKNNNDKKKRSNTYYL